MDMQPSLSDLNFQVMNGPVTSAERQAIRATNGNRAAISTPSVLIAVFLGGSFLVALALSASVIDLGFSLLWLIVGAAVFGMLYRAFSNLEANAVRGKRFADANNFSFVAGPAQVDQSGAIWQLGNERQDLQLLIGSYQNRPFECGTHFYTIGSGRTKRRYGVSFVRVTLPSELPHVLIDARRNVVNLSEGINRSQRLSLEGDFDKYFTVYCPAGYQRDVLYFLTPELMETMIENDRTFDMEVMDDKLYFYCPGLLTYNEKTLRQLFEILKRTGGEFAENTRLYHDDHAGAINGEVAPGGMQLRHHVILTKILTFVLIVSYVVTVLLFVKKGGH